MTRKIDWCGRWWWRPARMTPSHITSEKQPASRPFSGSRLGAQPPFGGEALLGQEASLVVHLARIPDPIAEIDIGKAHAPCAGDVIEDHEGSERAVAELGLVERIDHRQAVLEHV